MSYMSERLFANVARNEEAARALGPHRPDEIDGSVAVLAEAFELALRFRLGPLPQQQDIEKTVDGIIRRMTVSVGDEDIEALVRFHLGEETDVAGIDQEVSYAISLGGFLMLAWASPPWSEEDVHLLLQEADRRVRARGLPLPPAQLPA